GGGSSSQYESMFIDWPGDPSKPTWGGMKAPEEKSCWPAWCDILNRRAERGFTARNESDSRKGCGSCTPPGFVATMLRRVSRQASRDEFDLSNGRLRDGGVLSVFHAEPVVSRFSAAA